MSHWADTIAEQVSASGRPPVISTGISPSGEIHIGNLREVLTADAVLRALVDRGVQARLHYVCDEFDPLRKVYPFLDAAAYEPRVGRPLSRIPCPCRRHASYADHFLEPFLESLERLYVELEVVRADALYRSGRMTRYVVRALEQRGRIAAILQELTGKRMGDDWFPFQPLCPACGAIDRVQVVGFSAGDETVEYECPCGSRGSVPLAGGGKLTWRVDWPARWMALGVSVEPFGKDHATRGGSYDTGARIVREVFEGEPPFPVPYEWIRLKGGGDMAGSKGNVLGIATVLDAVPPEVLRYVLIRERPQKRIAFDPGLPMLQAADELEQGGSDEAGRRAVELATPRGYRRLGIPYKHLVVVLQAARFDREAVGTILRRGGYAAVDPEILAAKSDRLQRWLERFAPEALRFRVQDTLPAEAKALVPGQRAFLGRLADGLQDGMDGEQIHALIHRLAGETPDAAPSELFSAIYLALLGKPRGPRAGWFLSLLGAPFVVPRLKQAARDSGD